MPCGMLNCRLQKDCGLGLRKRGVHKSRLVSMVTEATWRGSMRVLRMTRSSAVPLNEEAFAEVLGLVRDGMDDADAFRLAAGDLSAADKLAQLIAARLDGMAVQRLLVIVAFLEEKPADHPDVAAMVGAVIAMRRKAPFLKRPYKTIGYPAPPVIYIVLSSVLVLDFLYLKPWTSGIGFLIVLAGAPVYYLWNRSSAPAPKPREPKPEPTSEPPDDR